MRIAQMSFRIRSSTRAASSRTFVLIHGIGTSHRYMARLHDQLATQGDVHSIDLPGFGGMPKPTWSATVSDIARALGELLTELEVAHAILVGHSMGSQWVVELAARRPELAGMVVLIGPVTDDEHRSVRAQSAALIRDILGEPFDANLLVFADYLRCGPVWYSKQLPHMLAYPIERRVAALSAPVLVVRGGSDPVAGVSWCRRLRDSAQNGRLVAVPSHRHVVQFTAAPAVASAIQAHLPGSELWQPRPELRVP
ncbi:alpha/beta fold hydrolase [Microbacterium deminutum]|uniref:Alpha/beta fold hydrolase n=1 Tax=Microbacterium deminutum TaxID=344164 RepID=A0ABN2QHK3_9MICO